MSKPVFEGVFRLSGRRNRKSYFLFVLTMLAVWSVIVAGWLWSFGWSLAAPAGGLFAVTAAAMVVTAWAGLTVGAQRCRDFGWTGWAILIVFLPYVGWIFGLALLFIPGTLGANRYGPDPLPPPPDTPTP